MAPAEPRSFDDDHLDPGNEEQVQAWAARYAVDPDLIREACAQVGTHRTAVELLLTAPPPE